MTTAFTIFLFVAVCWCAARLWLLERREAHDRRIARRLAAMRWRDDTDGVA